MRINKATKATFVVVLAYLAATVFVGWVFEPQNWEGVDRAGWAFLLAFLAVVTYTCPYFWEGDDA